MKVIWSLTAERNLDAIWEYIAQNNLDAADRMIARLREASGYLSDHPLMGRTGRARGTRELVVSGTPHILLYRPLRSHVDVARVLHGAQDWPPKG
jgi:toxin ParE1/3/4